MTRPGRTQAERAGRAFGVEWSDGTLPAAGFDPARLDARHWAAAARAVGARSVVLTAKHHDGFCPWSPRPRTTAPTTLTWS
ncbi:MAG: alpha-L-fucosidase [Actinobacteria bacterium]|nr:alpha-L-fucosidase [Actinomycetota bacterium]